MNGKVGGAADLIFADIAAAIFFFSSIVASLSDSSNSLLILSTSLNKFDFTQPIVWHLLHSTQIFR